MKHLIVVLALLCGLGAGYPHKFGPVYNRPIHSYYFPYYYYRPQINISVRTNVVVPRPVYGYPQPYYNFYGTPEYWTPKF